MPPDHRNDPAPVDLIFLRLLSSEVDDERRPHWADHHFGRLWDRFHLRFRAVCSVAAQQVIRETHWNFHSCSRIESADSTAETSAGCNEIDDEYIEYSRWIDTIEFLGIGFCAIGIGSILRSLLVASIREFELAIYCFVGSMSTIAFGVVHVCCAIALRKLTEISEYLRLQVDSN